MRALRATFQTICVLLGLWGILAMVGLVAGVVPLRVSPPSVPEPTVVADAGVPNEPDAGTTSDAGVDAAIPEVAVVPAVPVVHADRWIVCPEPTIAPSLSAVDLFGDARAELVVGCGDHWAVITLDGGIPRRVARVDAPTTNADTAPFAGAAAAADFDGDGATDLILPLARYGAGGSARAGGLYVVSRDRSGGLGAARALAPIAAVAVAADGSRAGPIAALHQSNALSRLPAEAWVFAGGASPARRAVLRSGVGAQAVTWADVNRDGQRDVVVAASEDGRVDVFFGDGTGAYPRHHTVALSAAVGLATGSVDGPPDLFVEAAGVVRVRSRGDELELSRIDAAPATLRNLEVADVTGDGRAEIVGWDHPRLVVIEPQGDAFALRAPLELASGSFGPRRQRIADLDGAGSPELALLGVSAIDGQRTLELVIVPADSAGSLEVGERRALVDAPLSLRTQLPDAQAP